MSESGTASPEPARSPADDTETLLRRWHAGDQRAVHELIQRDLAWIRSRVRRGLGDVLRQHGDTDDFLGHAVVDILAWTPKFVATDREVFRRLVARIVENSLRGQFETYTRMRRDRSRQQTLHDDAVLELQGRTGTTPSQHAGRQEEEAWLRLALDLIDPDDRDVIVLREWRGEPFATIGERLGVPENTARMRFQRALGRLSLQVDALRRGIV